MGNLLAQLSVPLFVILFVSFIIFLFRVALRHKPDIETKKPNTQSDMKKKGDAWIKRKTTAKLIKKMLSQPDYEKLYKSMILSEVELAELIKPMKKRLIIDRNYEKIVEANKAGDLKKVVELIYGGKK